MSKVTLGGDRLGTGKKMQVELHNYGRSTHDLGYVFRTTMAAGTLVPFMKEVGLPGDTFDIDLNCDIKTHPTIGPLFGSYKVQLDIFECPVRLYQGQLHNNKLGIGMKMADVKLPIMKLKAQTYTYDNLPADLDNSQINPSCILSYLGIRGVGIGKQTGSNLRPFNAVPFLAYWDIYKNYYANKQEGKGKVIHSTFEDFDENVNYVKVDTVNLDQAPNVSPIPLTQFSQIEINITPPLDLNVVYISLDNGLRIPLTEIGIQINQVGNTYTFAYKWAAYGNLTALSWDYHQPGDQLVSTINIEEFDLKEIDDMREKILAASVNSAAFNIQDPALAPYKLIFEESSSQVFSRQFSQEGLGLKTYLSDVLNNWLDTDWIDGDNGINSITAVDTSGGSFTIDAMQLAKKVYDMLNRIAVSGGSYNDWIESVYTSNIYRGVESPVYQGGLIKELIFQEVVSNAAAQPGDSGGEQPLGTLAGKGIMAHKHKGGKVTIRCQEPCYIMGIVSITPRLDYSQGNDWDINLQTMDDFHKPALDEIGFQELPTERMAWWDTEQDGTGNWIIRSAGKQPAWIEYMTNLNRVRGNFAIPNNEMFMVLNRRYTPVVVGGNSIRIEDVTTYIDPTKFNNIFAQTSLDAQNFWVQIAADITARRVMSAKMIPNL